MLAVKQNEAYVSVMEKMARAAKLSETAWSEPRLAPASARGKKLALLVAAKPEAANFRHGMKLAEAALKQGAEVYLYLIDDAVAGAGNPLAQKLAATGLKLFACAESAQRRRLPMTGQAHYAGLGMLSNLVAAADRFVSFL